MKSIFTLLIVASSVFATTAQQKAYQYTYDDAGNRTLRNMIILPPLPPGGGESEYVIENNTITDSTSFKKRSETQGAAEGKVSITLYPNPTSSLVHIQFSNSGTVIDEVRVIDGKGQVILKQGSHTGDLEVPFEGYEPGTYYIWLRFGEEVKRYQVVKQ